ncbi:predicted protein [Histoplasma capsulatum var. duboisii H88]|uniref:Predicted protein n=1 Tax=Ajellomyces capsulatus (strain H88) TaxID=544711 RepID=F0ULR4_AJEC8|nr:predicted protein [Histoplasma capsulatum var. duboisii H88]
MSLPLSGVKGSNNTSQGYDLYQLKSRAHYDAHPIPNSAQRSKLNLATAASNERMADGASRPKLKTTAQSMFAPWPTADHNPTRSTAGTQLLVQTASGDTQYAVHRPSLVLQRTLQSQSIRIPGSTTEYKRKCLGNHHLCLRMSIDADERLKLQRFSCYHCHWNVELRETAAFLSCCGPGVAGMSASWTPGSPSSILLS